MEMFVMYITESACYKTTPHTANLQVFFKKKNSKIISIFLNFLRTKLKCFCSVNYKVISLTHSYRYQDKRSLKSSHQILALWFKFLKFQIHDNSFSIRQVVFFNEQAFNKCYQINLSRSFYFYNLKFTDQI